MTLTHSSEEPPFDVPTSPGVNRTQEAGAYARYHYRRGYEDAKEQYEYTFMGMYSLLIVGYVFGLLYSVIRKRLR